MDRNTLKSLYTIIKMCTLGGNCFFLQMVISSCDLEGNTALLFCFLSEKQRKEPWLKKKKKARREVQGKHAFTGLSWVIGLSPPTQHEDTTTPEHRTQNGTRGSPWSSVSTHCLTDKSWSSRFWMHHNSVIITAPRKIILNKIILSPKNVKGTVILVSQNISPIPSWGVQAKKLTF